MGIAASAKQWLPDWAFLALTRWNRTRRLASGRDGQQTFARLGSPSTVLAGPFAGLRYLSEAAGSQLPPKVLGTYERELHPTLEAMVARDPDVVVDVGAAEGYYAVGLARRLPAARVIAYDTDRYARHLLGRMIALNDVAARVEPRGFCTAAELESVLSTAARPAVVSDCEGFEDQLLVPASTPSLRRADVLVEVHDGMCPGVSDRLRERFSATHAATFIPVEPRTAGDCVVPTPLSPAELTAALDEHRWGTPGWLYFTPQT